MIVNKNIRKIKTTNDIVLYFILLLLFSSLVSFILTNPVWSEFTLFIRTILILMRIFISLCIFGVVWTTSDFNDLLPSHRILGFGLFIVAILDIFHICTYSSLSFYPNDISIRYWIEARVIKGVALFLMTFPTIKLFKNKIVLLTLSIVAVSIIIALSQFSKLFPPLYAENGFTYYSKFIEYSIVFVYIVVLFRQHKGIKNNNQGSYHHCLTLALLCFILSELVYIPFTSPIHFTMAFGHLVKLCGYFLLLRAIFVSSIINPCMELRASRNKLNEVLDKLPLGILNYDRNLNITYANQYALNLLECDLSDICQITRDEYFVKFKIVDSVINHDIKKLQTNKGKELIFKTCDIEFENGIISTIKDARMEQYLENFNMHTHAILSAINNQVIIYDKNYKIIDCNNPLLQCIDLQKESIIGLYLKDFNNLLHKICNGKIYKSTENQKEDYTEYTYILPNGDQKNVLIQYKDIVDVYGEVIGHASITIDLTDIKRDQEMLQNQERLALIGQMGSGIVHETKNYLASIKGYCELLLLKLADKRQIGYASKIQLLANDMNGLVTDYLNLSKPSETILDILSLNELIESIQYIIESPSFVLGSTLEIDLCETDVEILADDNHIKHVIINLAKNAIEAMKDKADAHLTIRTKCTTDSMQVIISDNGMGISPEHLKKLGTPFFTTKKTGTGLGLSNCYKIVNDCGGQILVESDLGKGTTFTLEFPFYEEDAGYLEEVQV